MKPACRTESAAAQVRRNGPADLSAGRWLPALYLCAVVMVCGCRSTSPSGGWLASTFALPDSSTDTLALREGKKFTAEGRKAVEKAHAAFEQQDYVSASGQYRKIARKYQGTSIGEEAQFRLAECRFAQQRFADAQDAYDQLFIDYPATRYVETSTKRLYQIAQNWLDIADPEHRGEIRTVSATEIVYEPPAEQAPESRDPTVRYPILPNFHDSTRPVFDTQGRALEALKDIWLNDPTGPLADDALRMTAMYYLRKKDYAEADRYFSILREEYPDSPFSKEAHLLGSHVRLMSYQGPAYDGSTLDGAEQLTAQSLNLFPDSSNRGQLKEDLQQMYQLRAQRLWKKVEYWSKKPKSDRAVAIACVQLIGQFPDTKYAEMARDRLTQVDRRELADLPVDLQQALDSLPTTERRRDDNGRLIKSVSDSQETSPF